MSADPVYFLVHVPKCAGTTVEAHFEQHLGAGYLHAPRWDSVVRNFTGNRYSFGVDDPLLAPVRAVSGHSLSANLADHFPGREVRECVLLREPEGFFLSFWNYRMARHYERGQKPPPDFLRWYGAQRRNQITRFLLGRYFGWGVPALYALSTASRLEWLEARLARFRFVGGHRHASEMIAGISRDLGIPEGVEDRNVGQDKVLAAADLDPALRERIARENRADQLLHERWKDRRWQGAPDTPLPPLPRLDQPGLLIGDIAASLRKKTRL